MSMKSLNTSLAHDTTSRAASAVIPRMSLRIRGGSQRSRGRIDCKFLPIMIVTLTVVMAGCVFVPSSNYHQIYFTGEMGAENSTFRMVGEVGVQSGAAPEGVYRNVEIVLYSDDYQAIRSIGLGDLGTSEATVPLSQEVNVTSEQVPQYVLIESPDFWTEEGELQVDAYRRQGSDYKLYTRTEPDQKFPS